MYTIVGCSECNALWIVAGQPHTTGCPRCGKTHEFASLRAFAETDDLDTAKRARGHLLAQRYGDSDQTSNQDELGITNKWNTTDQFDEDQR